MLVVKLFLRDKVENGELDEFPDPVEEKLLKKFPKFAKDVTVVPVFPPSGFIMSLLIILPPLSPSSWKLSLEAFEFDDSITKSL